MACVPELFIFGFDPDSIECNLTNALSKQNIRVDVPCRFTVGISTEPDSMTNAAERLLGQRQENIQDLAKVFFSGSYVW